MSDPVTPGLSEEEREFVAAMRGVAERPAPGPFAYVRRDSLLALVDLLDRLASPEPMTTKALRDALAHVAVPECWEYEVVGAESICCDDKPDPSAWCDSCVARAALSSGGET